VHSTVFRWRFASRFAELGVDNEGFLRFVRQAFAQKRKTLANNLLAAGYHPEAVQIALTSASIQSQTRAEALSIEELARLFINLEKERAASSSEAVTPVKQ
jgi:16S rRNA (adenine1518-N6/adenine1519-N6)-dimethyltransferase